MSFRKSVLGWAVVAAIPCLALAHEDALEATLGYGQYRAVSNRAIDDANYKYLGLGYHVNEEWMVELFDARHDTGSHPGVADIDASTLGLKGLYSLRDHHETAVPYLLLGLDELKLKGAMDLNETGVMLGLGVRFTLTDWLRLRLEVSNTRYEETHENDAQAFLGLGFVWGGRHAAAAPAPVKVAAAMPAPSAPVDVVVAAPVRSDSDADGVYDDEDRCAGTPAGLKVGVDGCALLTEKVSIQLNVKFASGKADIQPEFAAEIEKVAEFMRSYPSTKVVIEGHTDDVGDAGKNKALSQRRADAVAASLVQAHGVDAARVSAVGYGEDKALGDNQTADGRAQNRRVTAEIDEQVTTKQ